jgi:hypothetical protein
MMTTKERVRQRELARRHFSDHESEHLINPLRGMHWDGADPVIEALMDVVDAVNDLQRAYDQESPDWRIDEAWDRRKQAIRRLATISERWDGSA